MDPDDATERRGPGAGWYPDPSEAGWLRWWDGTAWREWRSPAIAPRSNVVQVLGTVAVALVGTCLWLLSIGILLLEDLEGGDSGWLEPAKRVAAVAFFGIPFAMAAGITAIWLVPRRRRRRHGRSLAKQASSR